MMGIYSKHICTLLLFFGMVLPSVGQELSSHIIYNLIATGKKNAFPSADYKQFALITIDSIQFGATNQGAISYIDFKQKSKTETTFKRGNGKWIQSTGKSASLNKEDFNDFTDFLLQFSQNKEFQINHTIFPFPANTFVGKEQTNRKLTMPRDWNHLNFTANFPQMIHFKSTGEGNNRKICIYKMGRMTDMYNFIRINKQWYMIEKYEYE